MHQESDRVQGYLQHICQRRGYRNSNRARSLAQLQTLPQQSMGPDRHKQGSTCMEPPSAMLPPSSLRPIASRLNTNAPPSTSRESAPIPYPNPLAHAPTMTGPGQQFCTPCAEAMPPPIPLASNRYHTHAWLWPGLWRPSKLYTGGSQYTMCSTGHGWHARTYPDPRPRACALHNFRDNSTACQHPAAATHSVCSFAMPFLGHNPHRPLGTGGAASTHRAKGPCTVQAVLTCHMTVHS